MSRVVVIGATGHIGSFLVPRLVRAGHEVVAVSRGERDPYVADAAWNAVTRERLDRDAAEAAGTFGERIAALAPDAVLDMTCFEVDSARQLVEALRGPRPLLVHCGTIWVHGPGAPVPVGEDDPRTAIGDYGVRKAAVEALLHRETLAGGVPSVVLHPGHIVGPWPSVTPQGNRAPATWRALALDEPLALPEQGLGLLHHVHADDVARAFELTLTRPGAIGSSFHVVAARAMSLHGLATGVAGWFGRPPRIELLDWPAFTDRVGADASAMTYEHVRRSVVASIDRAREVLGFTPRYSALQALRESLRHLVAAGEIDLPGLPA